MLKTSEEWQKECTVIILDPDGWDRQNYQHSWYEEKITQSEFEKRMVSSTVKFTKPIFDDKNNINEIWINKRGETMIDYAATFTNFTGAFPNIKARMETKAGGER